jgi:hypothetical protein
MTGAAVNDRQNMFCICWNTYVDNSRNAQPTAAKERAFLLAKSRRTDRIEYCKLEITGKALAKWAYLQIRIMVTQSQSLSYHHHVFKMESSKVWIRMSRQQAKHLRNY